MCKILAFESSCDDTAVSVLYNGKILTNFTSAQAVHKKYGGVVPELASRAHQKNIIHLTRSALDKCKLTINNMDAIAFTAGPGLLGSLLVGASFAKGISLAANKPLIAVDHLHAHIISHFINEPKPEFPFLNLLVSGGHTMLIQLNSPLSYDILGQTLDDAAGEAFDKGAKIMGLPYPGGPLIDKYAQKGNADRFKFPVPKVKGLDFSFSGLKTALLYFIKDQLKNDPEFIQKNLEDLCASYQKTIVKALLEKLEKAVILSGIKNVGIAGGVAANSLLRQNLVQLAKNNNWKSYIPEMEYCVDNAAMIAMLAYYKYKKGDFCSHEFVPYPRKKIN